MSTDDTRAGEVAAEEVEGLARAIKPLAWATTTPLEGIGYVSETARAQARSILASDWLAAHDARVRAADAAEIARLTMAVRHQEGLTAAAWADASRADAERDRLTAQVDVLNERIDWWIDKYNTLAAGVRELADEYEMAALEKGLPNHQALRLRALLGPADDGEAAPESTGRLLEAPEGAVRPDAGGSAGSVGG